MARSDACRPPEPGDPPDPRCKPGQRQPRRLREPSGSGPSAVRLAVIPRRHLVAQVVRGSRRDRHSVPVGRPHRHDGQGSGGAAQLGGREYPSPSRHALTMQSEALLTNAPAAASKRAPSRPSLSMSIRRTPTAILVVYTLLLALRLVLGSAYWAIYGKPPSGSLRPSHWT